MGVAGGPGGTHEVHPLRQRQQVFRAQQPDSQGWFSSVVYGNGMFVAVGNGHQERWPLDDPPTFGPPGSAGYSTNTNSAPLVVTKDGIHWRALRRGGSTLNAVAFGNNRFVAVGLRPDGIITSRDSYSWVYPTNFVDMNGRQRTRDDAITYLLPYFPTQVAYGNGTFIVLGQVGSVLISTNGLDWVSYGPNAVSWLGSGHSIFNGLNALDFNGSLFIAAPYDGGAQRIFASRRGAHWPQVASPSFRVLALGHGGTQTTAAVGQTQRGSWVQFSDDGLDWSATPTQITGVPYAIGYGERGFVIVGANGLILQSTLPRSIPMSGVP